MNFKRFSTITLNKFRKNLSKIKSSMLKTYSNDSYVNTEVVYNVEQNFIILISFTRDYFDDAIEFLVSCIVGDISVKYSHSSYNEIIDENEGKIIVHDKYYILIGGNSNAYSNIFKNISNLNNSILDAISMDIINHRSSSDFKDITDVLSLSLFKYNAIKPKYDELVKINNSVFSYDDVQTIMSKIPEAFTGQDILPFINSYTAHGANTIKGFNAYDMLDMAYNKHDCDCIALVKEFMPLFRTITNNPSESVLKNFVGPQYLVCNEDTIPGDISDENLDAIFRQSYDRFNAIRSSDIMYEDIDEVIGSDEEGQNMRSDDIINEAEEDY